MGLEKGELTWELQVPLNPAFSSLQVISALSHLEAAHLIIGTETNLPYKKPRENITLLREIAPDLSSSSLQSASVRSLRNIILVDNSQKRIDTSSFKATTAFADLANGSVSEAGKELVPDEPLDRHDTMGSSSVSGCG
jgi:hypothetical protein